MATTLNKPVSSIAMALAGKSGSVDIPKPREVSVHEAFAAGTASAKAHRPSALLTPPNSLSPTLPPHKVRADALQNPPPIQVDSDIDLQDAVEHAKLQDQPTALSSAALSGLEAGNAITPMLLAREHLPGILVQHGPMAIRHVLNLLTQTVPGFSGIPPAKARRLVVAALEQRGGGGPNGEVLFEKVGWGRWDARLRGQPAPERIKSHFAKVPEDMSPPASMPDSYAMSNSGGLQIPQRPHQRRDDHAHNSWGGDSQMSAYSEEMDDRNMAEHEADKMSLDGDDDGIGASSSASRAGDRRRAADLAGDFDDATDEEDWAMIGAAALRQASLPVAGGGRLSRHHNRRQSGQPRGKSRNAPRVISSSFNLGSGFGVYGSTSEQLASSNINGVMGMNGMADSQEREAIAALLSMGSM
ncbi:hypothetical protein M501DRAFT_1006441 [Patellaria atrata CBS 101060]|uniref:Sin3 binding protein n=1 Tax=Patellaria atrata CBS 101060 TaxID=1346257 RepID=A0A9P4S8G8_9PEZI|nr:hypothetical protein M501DRAFT_1006441 [Patellaria atrata CBS 101060]